MARIKRHCYWAFFRGYDGVVRLVNLWVLNIWQVVLLPGLGRRAISLNHML